ncbi:MAG: V-type ATPase subunit [bacterium]
MFRISFHNIRDDTRYAFAVAKIRAFESRMLDGASMTRFLKSSGSDEMIRMLLDTEYNEVLNESGAAPFETVLDKELDRIYRTVHEIDPDPEWTDLLRWRYDAHNIKVLLKGGVSNEEVWAHCIPYGVLQPDQLIRDLQQGDLTPLPEAFQEAVNHVMVEGEGQGTKTGQEIDFMVDRALYRHLFQEAARSKNPFIRNMITIMIDCINLRSFLRTRGLQTGTDLFHQSFIPGGSLIEDVFSAQVEGTGFESLRAIITDTPYSDLKRSLDAGNMAVLEAAMDNFLIDYLRQTRQRAFGVEPLIGYMLGKEMEIKNLRIIYVCKVNGFGEEPIKERLRDTYV